MEGFLMSSSAKNDLGAGPVNPEVSVVEVPPQSLGVEHAEHSWSVCAPVKEVVSGQSREVQQCDDCCAVISPGRRVCEVCENVVKDGSVFGFDASLCRSRMLRLRYFAWNDMYGACRVCFEPVFKGLAEYDLCRKCISSSCLRCGFDLCDFGCGGHDASVFPDGFVHVSSGELRVLNDYEATYGVLIPRSTPTYVTIRDVVSDSYSSSWANVHPAVKQLVVFNNLDKFGVDVLHYYRLIFSRWIERFFVPQSFGVDGIFNWVVAMFEFVSVVRERAETTTNSVWKVLSDMFVKVEERLRTVG
jgi:hypothetical protein